jgi:hypothetical protein
VYRHGTGRTTDLWKRLTAADWDEEKMWGMEVYRERGEARRSEWIALERKWWRRKGREMRRREGITSISDRPFSNPNYAVRSGYLTPCDTVPQASASHRIFYIRTTPSVLGFISTGLSA